MKKKIILIAILTMFVLILSGCDTTVPAAGSTAQDISSQQKVADTLAASQATPTDINYSLERYNLIRRAYWVNGQREKANTLVCQITKPLGYIVLFAGNTIVNTFILEMQVLQQLQQKWLM